MVISYEMYKSCSMFISRTTLFHLKCFLIKTSPGTAKKLTSSYYGTPDNKLPVDIFQFQLGPNTHFVNIGQNCTPVFDSAFGSLNNGRLNLQHTQKEITSQLTNT